SEVGWPGPYPRTGGGGPRPPTRRPACSCATAASRWRRSSSMPRAGAAKPARLRNDRSLHRLDRPVAPPRRGDGAALSLPPALVLDAAAGVDLLARGAVVRLGFLAVLHRAELRFLRPRQRRLHRRRADVGRAVPRPAR